jgi:curli biogenesis system outer membrane secretion channel CsgG
MTKKYLLLAVALIGFSATATPAFAQGQAKIRVALWDFDNNSEQSWWFRDQMGNAARNNIDTAFSENAELSKRFTVLEREKLAMVMKEQGLAAGGAVDPQSAARVGKLLGVRYIITGGIDKFSINTTRGGIGGIGGSSTTAEATINLRFIDTTTAERIVSISADGSVRKGGGFIRGASLSRENEWGIASEAIEKAAAAVVTKLVAGPALERVAEAAGSTGGVDMRIIKVDGRSAYINVGSSTGIKVGDKFTIYRPGEALIDPVTGMNLGSTEKQVGTLVVTDVQERFSIATITGAAAASDIVKR